MDCPQSMQHPGGIFAVRSFFKTIGKGVSRKKEKGGLLPRRGVRRRRMDIFGFLCFFARRR